MSWSKETSEAAGRLCELADFGPLGVALFAGFRPRRGEIRRKKLLMEVLTERLAGVSWFDVLVQLLETADTELHLHKNKIQLYFISEISRQNTCSISV